MVINMQAEIEDHKSDNEVSFFEIISKNQYWENGFAYNFQTDEIGEISS